jgi:hypothetical protein
MSSPNANREREIAERARELFARSVQGVDGHTRSKLARARAGAVEAAAAGRQRWLPSRSVLVPAGGFAAAALALALVWQNPAAPPAAIAPAVLSDLDLLLDGEDLDLLEDLDFYAWLLAQPELLDGNDAGDGSG